MALSDEQRGPRAAWIRRNRLRLYGYGDGGLDKFSKALGSLGIVRSPATLKGWESSDERSPVPEDLVPVLETLFDDPAPKPLQQVSQADLIAALSAQTEAMNTLARQIELSRLGEDTRSERLMTALGELLDRLGKPDSTAPATPGRTDRPRQATGKRTAARQAEDHQHREPSHQ